MQRIRVTLRLSIIFLIVTFLVVTSSVISSCTKTTSPPCNIDKNYIETTSANGGCLIKHNNQLLVIIHRLNNKLGIPGGTNKTDESAQCTAHRETWEETGYSVTVGKELQVFNNGFHLYHCYLNNESSTTKKLALIQTLYKKL